MSNSIIVIGTDTNVGKTRITGLLAAAFVLNGFTVITRKWIQTGLAVDPVDTEIHDEIRRKINPQDFACSSGDRVGYSFFPPVSPHLAAKLSNQRIRTYPPWHNEICPYDWELIEGAGGLLVPISKKKTVADWISVSQKPVLVVAANRVGAINHTLLTIESLQKRNIPILGIIMNQCDPDISAFVLADNPVVIASQCGVPILFSLQFNLDISIGSFSGVIKKILQRFKKLC